MVVYVPSPACLPEILVLQSNMTSPSNTPNIKSHVFSNSIRERFPSQDITDCYSSTRLEESINLFKNGLFVCRRHQVDNTVVDNAVNAGVRQRYAVDIGFDDLCIGQTCILDVLLSELFHVLSLKSALTLYSEGSWGTYFCHVNANGLSIAANFTSRQKHINAAATAKIQNRFALRLKPNCWRSLHQVAKPNLFQVRETNGISTA